VARLDELGDKVRAALDEKNGVREEALAFSREIIRTSANSIRSAHRGELDRAPQLLLGAATAVRTMRERLKGYADIYGSGYVHDCQKEYAEAAIFLALVRGEEVPDPDGLEVEYPAYLNGMGEAVGELRRHTLDVMRQGDLERAEALLAAMDEIYYLLVTFDYPDALTGGLRRTTDAVRGIIEKTRGELTTALRQEALRDALEEAVRRFGSQDGADAG
jgi:translin